MTPIDDMNDARLEPYRNVRDRDLVGRRDRFILEGKVVLEAALTRGRFPIESVLVSQKRVGRFEGLLARVPDDVPVYVAPHEVMCAIVGFDIHRGLIAVGRCDEMPSAAELLATLPERATVLVIEGLTDHDNVGACFRNAAGFGADAVLLDDRCCVPLYRKSIRVSVGHALSVPFNRREPMASILSALSAEGFERIALSLSRAAEVLDDRRRPAPRLALMLGSEGPGLSAAALEAADRHMYIPMAEGVDSLNVAVAGAVALFALRATDE